MVMMAFPISKFNKACKSLERQGFAKTEFQWSDLDKTKLEIAQVLHPNGSYLLYIKERVKS